MTRFKGERIPPSVKRQIIGSMHNCIATVGKDECRYLGDASDQSLANDFGVSLWTISNIRRQIYGKMIGDNNDQSTPMGRVWAHIHALETEVAELRQRISNRS